jgi:hypothetical protein
MNQIPTRADLALSRRGFLITVTAAGATFSLSGPAEAAETYAPTLWYTIDKTGQVTGQHHPRRDGPARRHRHRSRRRRRAGGRLVEGEVHPRRLRPKWGLMVTGGSWSVWQSYPLYSQAAAAGRIALVNAGAKLMGVPAQSCVARNGAVVAGKRRISFGDIVAKGELAQQCSAEELAKMPIKKPVDRRLIGKPAAARDIPGKTDGSGLYGLDAKVPGMVYARPKLPPTRYGNRVEIIDDSACKAIPGYFRAKALDDPSNTVPGWVVVYADSFPAADKAVRALKITYSGGAEAKASPRPTCRPAPAP